MTSLSNEIDRPNERQPDRYVPGDEDGWLDEIAEGIAPLIEPSTMQARTEVTPLWVDTR